jgi:glutathione synthase
MTLRVAIQMDPIESINPKSDSTLLLGVEAIRRSYEVWHYTPGALSVRDGSVSARARRITFYDNAERYHEFGEARTLNLHDMDVVLLRQDPPFDMGYITSTYVLDMLAPKTLVVNNPTSVRNRVEKLFPVMFRKFMPPTLISGNATDIAAFGKEHKDIVLKPLYGFGGRSVFRTGVGDGNFQALLEMLLAKDEGPLVAQKFLPEVKDGDRRIVMIDGKISGAIGRIPAQGEIRANMRVGGTPAKAELTKRQRDICDAVGLVLKKEGLLFVGLDTIGDWLTEINITSPTGIRAINNLYGVNLEREFWDVVEGYLP